MSFFVRTVHGLGWLLGLIGVFLAYFIAIVLGLIALGVGAIFWVNWHPRVTVPFEGTNLVIVYHHEYALEAYEHLVLAEAATPGRPLAEARSEVYKYYLVGGDLWRDPDGSAFYLHLHSELYRIDVVKRIIAPFQFPKDSCPSDATAPKWRMHTTDPGRLRPRPADLVYIGAIRNDIFTPAERLPPPPLRRRNCAAEALAWDAGAFTTLWGTDLTIGLHLRWLPGKSVLREVSVVTPKSSVASVKNDPTSRTTSTPPRGRFSLYRDGDLVHLVDDGDTPMFQHMRISIAGRGFGEWAERPSCRADDAPPPMEQPAPYGRPSRFFERWVWLGRFEARFEPVSGRWGGDMVFLPADTATEEVLELERFCDPRGVNC